MKNGKNEKKRYFTSNKEKNVFPWPFFFTVLTFGESKQNVGHMASIIVTCNHFGYLICGQASKN